MGECIFLLILLHSYFSLVYLIIYQLWLLKSHGLYMFQVVVCNMFHLSITSPIRFLNIVAGLQLEGAQRWRCRVWSFESISQNMGHSASGFIFSVEIQE